MIDLAAEFAKMPDGDQLPFMAGVTVAYARVFDAIATAFNDPAGLTKAYADVRAQYDEAMALVAVEGVMDDAC